MPMDAECVQCIGTSAMGMAEMWDLENEEMKKLEEEMNTEFVKLLEGLRKWWQAGKTLALANVTCKPLMVYVLKMMCHLHGSRHYLCLLDFNEIYSVLTAGWRMH